MQHKTQPNNVQGTVANTLKLLVQAKLSAPAAAAKRRSCLLLLHEHTIAGHTIKIQQTRLH
jgi:hypothetical protein